MGRTPRTGTPQPLQVQSEALLGEKRLRTEPLPTKPQSNPTSTFSLSPQDGQLTQIQSCLHSGSLKLPGVSSEVGRTLLSDSGALPRACASQCRWNHLESAGPDISGNSSKGAGSQGLLMATHIPSRTSQASSRSGCHPACRKRNPQTSWPLRDSRVPEKRKRWQQAPWPSSLPQASQLRLWGSLVIPKL